ncbi:HIT-like domain-containing protein [Xylaria sp. CBS 124048]|nr:HIT-like domain-containing protein [Xylaria sp. CBS 124048]
MLPRLVFYEDNQLLIGHSRTPTTPGHTLVTIKSGVNLFSLQLDEFIRVMDEIWKAASLLCKHYQVERCALVTEGNESLSLLPLHGLGKDWKPVTSNLKEFYESYPGYITSKDAPMMAGDQLDDICAKIKGATGLVEPFNYRFDGDSDNMNLFSRIIRGELPQWRVWEDDDHVAFLSPFANTPGFTVLVPRKHLSSNILSIDKVLYQKLVAAAHRVAGFLKNAFGLSQCGMIFEGFEIDYAHVKLIPIRAGHAGNTEYGSPRPISSTMVAPFHETYQGYVSSLNGPFLEDVESLATSTFEIRNMYDNSLNE